MTPRANRPPLGSPSPSRFLCVPSEVPGETAMGRGLSLGGLEHTKSVSPRRHGRYVALSVCSSLPETGSSQCFRSTPASATTESFTISPRIF